MAYIEIPLSFGDAAAVLDDAAPNPSLLKRLKLQPVLRWVRDNQTNSYLIPLSAETMFEGIGFIFFFKGNLYEAKSDSCGSRVAFCKPTGLTDSENAAVQEAFLEAFRIRGFPFETGPSVKDSPFKPVFVETCEELWSAPQRP